MIRLPFLRPSIWLAVALVLVAGFSATAWVYRWMAHEENIEAHATFDNAADIFFARTQARLRANSQLLHSLAGIARLLGRLDRTTLESYKAELDFRYQYPGFVAIGFVSRAPAGRQAKDGSGRWQLTSVEPATRIKLLGRNADLGADPDLQAVLDAARDSGDNAGTSHVETLISDVRGFLLVHPLYAGGTRPGDTAQRRRLIEGFVFVVFDAGNLLSDLGNQLPEGVAGRLLANLAQRDHESVLYDSRPKLARRGGAEMRQEIESVGGEQVLLEVAQTAAFGRQINRDRSELILALGSLSTLTAALMAWLFATRSAWAEERASRMATALQASEQRYAVAVETTTDGIWERDLDTGDTRVSPRFEALLGHDPGAFARTAVDPDILVHPADLPRRQKLLAAHLTRQSPYVIELRMRHADGHYLWVREHGRAIRDDAGQALRIVGSLTDVTDLHAALDRFRDLSQLASDWYWEQDEHYRFTGFSESLQLRSNIGAGGMLGKTRWELPFDIDPAIMAAHRRTVEAHQPFRDFEYRVGTEDGQLHWFSTSGKPLFDDDGKFVGYRGTSRDITAQKRIEQELRTHRDNLSTLVEAQTADLMHAKEAAEQASRGKSDFLANMSHELRTPMHAILSFARIGHSKAGSAPTEKIREYFDRIHASGERLLVLVSNLLDLSKLEAGKMTIEQRHVDLALIAAEVAHDLEGLVEARQQHLLVPTPTCDTVVVGDAVRLAQVLRNLISNALKFTPDGLGVRVEFAAAKLSTGRRAQDLGTLPALAMTVSDEGIGIPEGELETIFDKFHQSSATRTGAGGTGLGLSICHEIVAAHRGTIRARNRSEGGAAFEVILPTGIAV